MASKGNLTPRDIEVLSLAFQCLKDPSAVNVDYSKLAQAGNFKNAKSANAAFCVIRKKLDAAATSTTGDPSSPSKDQGKNATKSSFDDADDNASNDSNAASNDGHPKAMYPPPKKAKAPRKPKAAKTTVKVEPEDDDDDAAAGGSTLATPDTDSTDKPTTEVKPKRKYNRKPKDPNAPPAKKAKKQPAKGSATDDAEEGSAGDAETATSLFGGDNPNGIKTEPAADGETDDLSNLTTSQAQLAAENSLVVDAV